MVVDVTNKLFEEQLRTLRQAYIEQLQQTTERLADMGQRLQASAYASHDLQDLCTIAHGLAGSGATYGFTQISETAGRLDRYLQNLIENPNTPALAQRAYTDTLLADLYEATSNQVTIPMMPASTVQLVEEPPRLQQRSVVICECDMSIADDSARQISNFGYNVQTFSSISALQATEPAPEAAVLIIDIDFIPELANLPLSAPDTPAPAIVFTAARDDFATRLLAVRAGGAAFFTRPFDTTMLVDTLDNLTSARETEPYRILIIDDQALLMATYATTLRQAGMMVATVTNPLRVMSSLNEFQPDVMLLDMYMPGCTGIELATVLRQQAAYVSIPIVFLSAETQLDRQMEALKRGGDDFLTKPIQLDHLVAAVRSRANRARLLRSAMMRDSLTNLYNHTTTKEHLKREIARSVRQKWPTIFAMLDIDHFKSVNDTYGHVVGDHVIKSLARLLQQRLRKTDVIGRYGGEEFAVILPDTTSKDAYRLLDEIRERFEHVRQSAGEMTFACTFSCGYACFPDSSEPAELVIAADLALYHAKRNGRNRVSAAATDSSTES